jgi:cytochrome c biogenesis factor
LVVSFINRTFRLLASLKVAIPLIVILTAATIFGSLSPDREVYRSAWYLSLLGLLGLSLLFITLLHIPSIAKKKGRNALIGVVTSHLGILIVIAGIIQGGYSGFRHQVRLIEGEVAIVPGLPFVIQLDRLEVEEYRQEEFPRINLAALPKKVQDSHLTLIKGGQPWRSVVAAPGRPARVDGITLLPSVGEIGWSFELVVVDPLGRPKTIPVRPWAPPLVTIGQKQYMTHGVAGTAVREAQLFTLEGGSMASAGSVREGETLEIAGHIVSLGVVKRYTTMQVYNRPHAPVLVIGSILMFAGLVWHFYFRHRDRKRAGVADA